MLYNVIQMLYKCYTNGIPMVYKVIKVLYKCYTVCIYCVRIDSSGIAANTHRQLWTCKADRKIKDQEQEHSQEHEQEQTSSASQSIVIISGIAASHHQRHCRSASRLASASAPIAISVPAGRPFENRCFIVHQAKSEFRNGGHDKRRASCRRPA